MGKFFRVAHRETLTSSHHRARMAPKNAEASRAILDGGAGQYVATVAAARSATWREFHLGGQGLTLRHIRPSLTAFTQRFNVTHPVAAAPRIRHGQSFARILDALSFVTP